MQKRNLFLVLILIVSSIVYFLGALLPETGFDALWYHLTLPKLYLTAGKIYHITGGLLYYSEMPRFIEFIYLPLIKYFDYIGPHIFNWLTGIGTTYLIFKIARIYLNKTQSLFAGGLFYVTPIVGWLSASAYIDLPITFLTTLCVYLILENKLFLSAIVFGLVLSSKTLGFASFLPILYLIYSQSRKSIDIVKYIFISLIISIPWYLSAFNNTGNPFYPIGSGILDSTHVLPILSPSVVMNFFLDFWKLFVYPTDLITPIFAIVLPFAITNYRKLSDSLKKLSIFCLLSYVAWFMIPRTGGGRFILPYLPIWSVVLVATVVETKEKLIRYSLFFSALILIVFNLQYRTAAIYKARSYLLGQESKNTYLCNRLAFSIGEYYDCNGMLTKFVRENDKLLVIGVHNLYYINHRFVHETWYKGEKIDKILMQNTSIEFQRSRKDLIGELLRSSDWKIVSIDRVSNSILLSK